jgi:hypothetical protein
MFCWWLILGTLASQEGMEKRGESDGVGGRASVSFVLSLVGKDEGKRAKPKAYAKVLHM